jgi:hypothetical protein
MRETEHAPLRVEQALHLVPRLESLAPLRALLLTASSPDRQRAWASSEPYLTVGKRGIAPAELQERLSRVVDGVARHLTWQFEAALAALDRFHRGRAPEAVAELLAAGQREERRGQIAAARAWYATALDLAEGLADRRPEITALLACGGTDRRSGAFPEAARKYQRSLALAEAEIDNASVLEACLALGELAVTAGNPDGARAWYTRALRQAQADDHRARIGRVLRQLAALALRVDDVGEAPALLRRARECFRPDDDAADLARLLQVQGLLHELLADDAAVADCREALMWALRAANVPETEISIRLQLARLLLARGRSLEAEDELRRAEQRALSGGHWASLVHVYLALGDARTRALDENGFVFFEQALELCRSIECASLLEAEAYRAYGAFREALGDDAAARAYAERAAEILGRGVDPG